MEQSGLQMHAQTFLSFCTKRSMWKAGHPAAFLTWLICPFFHSLQFKPSHPQSSMMKNKQLARMNLSSVQKTLLVTINNFGGAHLGSRSFPPWTVCHWWIIWRTWLQRKGKKLGKGHSPLVNSLWNSTLLQSLAKWKQAAIVVEQTPAFKDIYVLGYKLVSSMSQRFLELSFSVMKVHNVHPASREWKKLYIRWQNSTVLV